MNLNITCNRSFGCITLWNATDDLACGIVTYHIKLVANESVIKENTTINKTYTLSSMTDLPQCGSYTVFVYGTNEAGDGQTANSSFHWNACEYVPQNPKVHKDESEFRK